MVSSAENNSQAAATSLTDNFVKYFSVELATTPEQLKNIFRIRYRVYCEEFGYESPEAFIDKMEQDDFDQHSLHCLITHKASQMPAACVRVIPATSQLKEGLLPLEKYAAHSLDSAAMKSLDFDRNTICEVSRLAVDCAFRRRSGEAATRFGEMDALDISNMERRTFGLIAVSGFLAAISLADITGVPNMFAMMEPFLPRLMNRSGICFQKIGNDIDYHGLRAPYFASTRAINTTLVPELRGFYDYIYGCLQTATAAVNPANQKQICINGAKQAYS